MISIISSSWYCFFVLDYLENNIRFNVPNCFIAPIFFSFLLSPSYTFHAFIKVHIKDVVSHRVECEKFEKLFLRKAIFNKKIIFYFPFRVRFKESMSSERVISWKRMNENWHELLARICWKEFFEWKKEKCQEWCRLRLHNNYYYHHRS